MLSKNGGNVWNSKKKSVEDDQRHALSSWPQLRKQESFRKGNEVESWPKLGVVHNRKNDAGNQKRESFHQKGSSGGNNVSPVGLSKPSVPLEESQEFTSKSQSNECKNSTNVKPMLSVVMSDSIHASQKSSLGNIEKVTLSNKEEKNLLFKKLNKERKEQLRAQRQRKKEDDTLRKMLGPKGLKVTVIDNNVFSKFCDQGDYQSRPRQTVSNVSEAQLDSSAFPELRTSSRNFALKYISSRPKKTYEIKKSSVPVGDNESKKFNTEDNIEKTLAGNTPMPTKSRKRRDPVVVDIWKAIEICKSGKKLEEGEVEEEEGVARVSRPKEEKSKIAGNILDSSNPSRHRGKKREIPKKRCETRLKKAIMAERRRRRDARNCGSKRVVVGNISSAHEAKSFDFSGETPSLVPQENDSCSAVEVTPGSKLLGNANELEDEEEKGEEIDKCLLKQCSTSTVVDVDGMTRDALHSRNFREYCHHSKSADLSENVKLMLKDILKFQDRMYATQPIKAESHRRYVVGLRQTQHLLAVHKVKIVIMAHDLEKVPSPGGLDDVVNSIKDSANKQCVPVVFPLTRRQLGKATYRKVGVSCVGVLNYQGSEENYKKVISSLEDSIKDYEDRFEKEKFRIMSELGILPVEKLEDKEAVNKEQVQPSPIQCAVTLPLFEKLTEALSELSIVSASQRAVKEGLCD